MTDIVLVIVIIALLVQNTAEKMVFLKHLKSLELKLMTGNPEAEAEAESANEIQDNNFRDISDVSLESIVNDIKKQVKK